jgi:NAD(P)-dependent dehydrogenase (short-subunit alcohol dehydrogenase family)
MTLLSLSEKVAVITGGASGIGLAVAQALAREKARLVLADVDDAALAAAVEDLRSSGAQVIGARTDVSQADQMEALADAAWSAYGAVHLVMHNAGVALFGPTQDMSQDDWNWVVAVNLWGPIHGARIFIPRMLAGGQEGHHVFTASLAGLVPNRELGPYNVTKAAVVALAESLRKDLRETPLGVSVLCPMRVTSNIDDSYRHRPAELGGAIVNTYTPEEKAALQGRTLEAPAVAQLVLDGVRRDQFYIHTHQEAEALFRRRADRIAADFKWAF